MFRRPYYHPYQEQPYFHYNQETNTFPHQPFHESPSYNRPPVHQTTPYEYFAKPQHPNWPEIAQQQNQENHPPQAPGNFPPPQMQPPPMKPMGTFMSNFQKEDGKVDIDKMLGTVGQMANTYHQVSPIFKQVGSFLKSFR